MLEFHCLSNKGNIFKILKICNFYSLLVIFHQISKAKISCTREGISGIAENWWVPCQLSISKLAFWRPQKDQHPEGWVFLKKKGPSHLQPQRSSINIRVPCWEDFPGRTTSWGREDSNRHKGDSQWTRKEEPSVMKRRQGHERSSGGTCLDRSWLSQASILSCWGKVVWHQTLLVLHFNPIRASPPECLGPLMFFPSHC